MITIPDRLYFRIGDVAEIVGVKPYILRYWETEFPMISPQKSSHGQRVYRRSDVEAIILIKHLLYEERYSLEGAKKRIQELRKARVGKQQSLPQKDFREFQVEVRKLVKEIHTLALEPLTELFTF